MDLTSEHLTIPAKREPQANLDSYVRCVEGSLSFACSVSVWADQQSCDKWDVSTKTWSLKVFDHLHCHDHHFIFKEQTGIDLPAAAAKVQLRMVKIQRYPDGSACGFHFDACNPLTDGTMMLCRITIKLEGGWLRVRLGDGDDLFIWTAAGDGCAMLRFSQLHGHGAVNLAPPALGPSSLKRPGLCCARS